MTDERVGVTAESLLLESSKSNFVKEIHYDKWNPHETFFVAPTRAPFGQVVMAMFNPSQSYSGGISLKVYMQY